MKYWEPGLSGCKQSHATPHTGEEVVGKILISEIVHYGQIGHHAMEHGIDRGRPLIAQVGEETLPFGSEDAALFRNETTNPINEPQEILYPPFKIGSVFNVVAM